MKPAPPIHFRLKLRPEDFQVEELADVRPRRRGAFRLYRLTKSGWNTIDVLLRISKRSGIPIEAFSYGGRKDRQAKTTQFITVASGRDLSMRERDYAIEALGYVDERMSPSRLLGNAFTITLRDLDPNDVATIERAIQIVARQGLTNYFDDQRFGSRDQAGGFAGERILKRDWEGAIRIHLTGVRAEEYDASRDRRAFFQEHWRDWKKCLTRAETVTERRVFQLLDVRHGGRTSYVAAVNLIPREEVSMALSAYQSFLWNVIAAEVTRDLGESVAGLSGAAGDYLFYILIAPDALARMRRLRIPMPGPRPRFADRRTAELYESILSRSGLMEAGFRTPLLQTAYLKSFPRPAHLKVDGLRTTEVGEDDMNPGRRRLSIRFRIPRGSYGTMVVKRLSVG